MEYNTNRPHLKITEYGRNIHKMIEYACSIEDRETRNKAAQTIVSIMIHLNSPQRIDSDELKQKIWDHLYIISDFKLDVDSPYPMPDPNSKEVKVTKCSYPNPNIRYRQYGKIMEKMISKAIEMEDGEEKNALIRYMANHLKKLYLSWNRESVNDELIYEHMKLLSGGKIILDSTVTLEQTRDLIAINNRSKSNVAKTNNNQNFKYKNNWRRKNKSK